MAVFTTTSLLSRTISSTSGQPALTLDYYTEIGQDVATYTVSTVLGAASGDSTASKASRTTGTPPGPTIATGNSTTSAGNSTNSGEPGPSPAGVSPGAAAGIAIGCVLIGLALGALAGFLFFSRRRKHQLQTEVVSGNYNEHSYESKRPAVTAAPAITDSTQLSQFLLAPKPDTELVRELRNLGEVIQLHVENNYHSNPVHQTAASLSEALADLGFGSNSTVAPAQLAALAIETRTRQVALQHVISQVVFGSVVVTNAGGISVLPASVATFVRDIAPVEHHRGSPQAFSLAFNRWRQLSAFLLHPSRSDRTALPVDAGIKTRAQQLVNQLRLFLGAFVDPGYKGQQEAHLQEVIVECAKFGNALLSQPDEFRLRFVAAQDFELVTCPGLDKFSDEQGNALNPPVRVLPPTTVTV